MAIEDANILYSLKEAKQKYHDPNPDSGSQSENLRIHCIRAPGSDSGAQRWPKQTIMPFSNSCLLCHVAPLT